MHFFRSLSSALKRQATGRKTGIIAYRLSLIALLLFPSEVFASSPVVDATVNAIGSALPALFTENNICTNAGGACGFVSIALAILVRFRPLLTIAGILVVSIYGIRMIIGQEDDVMDKSRTVMTGAIAGLITVYLIEPFILAFYGPTGAVPSGGQLDGALIVSTQVTGLINWALVIIGSLSVIMMIVTAIKALSKPGNEEGIANIRKTVLSIVTGLVLLVVRTVLSDSFVNSTDNPVPILALAVSIISFLMGFMALVAVLVVVYAGVLMILTLGNEERAGHARGLLGRAGLGLIVILISLSLVNFVILPGVQ